MKNENETRYIDLCELHTFAAQENDTYLAGVDDDGNDCTVVFRTVDLLYWLDIRRMKAQAKVYIDKL
jgi:hypothetical protein